jgi:GntR family transcriptional regulator
LWLTIDLHSDVPIYTQIRNGIIEGILTGELLPGEALPSVRQLASDLGINLHTANKAYGVLKQEGFIQVHRKKGAVINWPQMYRAGDGYYARLQEQIKPFVAEAFCRGLSPDDFILICRQVYTHYEKEARRNQDG